MFPKWKLLSVLVIVLCIIYISFFIESVKLPLQQTYALTADTIARLAQFSGSLQDDSCANSSYFLLKDEGRLANKVWEYFFIQILATRYGRRVVLQRDTKVALERYFQGITAPTWDELKTNCSLPDQVSWLGKTFPSFEKGEFKEANNSFVSIQGYPSAINSTVMAYMFDQRSQFLSQFSWNAGLVDRVTVTIGSMTENRTGRAPVVGIHVRRTDFESYLKNRFKQYKSATTDYYVRCMDYFRIRLKNPVFLVVSDDLNWCKQHLNGTDVFFPGTGNINDPGFDLALLTRCDNLILSYGTFGALAGFMNQNAEEILYADNFTTEANNPFHSTLKKSVPSNWNFVPV